MFAPDWFLYLFQNKLLGAAKIYKLVGFKRLGLKIEKQVAEMKVRRPSKGLKETPIEPVNILISAIFWLIVSTVIYSLIPKRK